MQGLAGGGKLRSMAWAVPALLERIPAHDAAHVGAHRRTHIEFSAPIPARGKLLQAGWL